MQEVGREAPHLNKRQWALQRMKTGLDETIKERMIATWSQRYKIFPVLDVFLLGLGQRLRVAKIVLHAGDFC
jgi:hypothetical protein